VSWARLDDGWWSHPKVLRAGNAAAGAYARMLSYCAQHLTDGRLDRTTALSIAGRDRVLAVLIEVTLLDEIDAETVAIHGYLERNPSRAEVERERAANRERQRRFAENSHAKRAANAVSNASPNAVSNSVSNGVTNDAPSHPIPSRPSPNPREEPRELATLATGARGRAPASAREGLFEEPPKAPAGARKARAAATPIPDPVPADGTPARRLYDAIVTDRVLGPITRGPGDLSERLSQADAYPGVDVLAEVRRAAAWGAGQRAGHWSDGRKALLGWLQRAADRVASTPKAAPSVTKGPVASCSREDYPWHEAEIDWFAPTNGGGQ
jgi:hypothetical protein